MYGYSDYNGPLAQQTTNGDQSDDYDNDDDDDNPLRAGLWMEGDSLAPPCGTSIPTIHRLLDFGHVKDTDVMYDLGCGDGRVCLEAMVKYKVKACVGVDIEQDLIQKFHYWIGGLPSDMAVRIHGVQADLRQVLSSLVVRAKGETLASSSPSSSDFDDLPLPTLIVLYLLPESIRELEEDLVILLTTLKPIRIICNTWGFSSIQPTQVLDIEEVSGGATTRLFLYSRDNLQK